MTEATTTVTEHLDKIKGYLDNIYEPDDADFLLREIQQRIDAFRQMHLELSQPVEPDERISEKDSILITYGNQVMAPNEPPLRMLSRFINKYLKDIVSGVHVLPFYPYSSDDGFAVIDYKAVKSEWGDWEDLQPLRQHFRLMFDAVINHVSAENEWFAKFKAGDPEYQNYFITMDPDTNLSDVTRPRTTPLLTPVETADGLKHVWCTFSADQVDINYAEPKLLLEIIDVLLFYVQQGAELIRLDAIAYMWKEIGSSCIHLPKTHRLIRLFRTILDAAAPNVLLITETNVPHAENISYFGDGKNEAQMVYNFTLAPLVLHTFLSGDATILRRWAYTLAPLPYTTTFFNFLASHDGIGVRPAEGILSTEQIDHLAETVLTRGGKVSYKTNPDGSQSPYELNITIFDALSDPTADETVEMQIDRFMAAQAIMLSMIGVPGIYIHSLFGSHNDLVGVSETGRARTINRHKWNKSEINEFLANPNSLSYKVFNRYVDMLKVRREHKAFHPNGHQYFMNTGSAFFTVLRIAPNNRERVLCIQNVTAQSQPFGVTLVGGNAEDLITGEQHSMRGNRLEFEAPPYAVRWLKIT